MEKLKRIRATLLSVSILIVLMTPVASAKSINEVVIYIPARNITTSYEAYEDLVTAKSNPIELNLNKDEFPVYVTLYGDNGREKEYRFDSYGTKLLEADDPGMGTVALAALTFPILGPLWIPEPMVYSTIIINPPQQERPRLTIPEEPYKRLEPLFDKIESMSDSLMVDYERHIKDYVDGKWDGTVKYNNTGLRYACIRDRTYLWRGYNPFTGKNYKDIDVNIDYVGPLDVVTNRYFTFAVNYDTGKIEQWQFLEKKDSWRIQLAEGEKIEIVSAPYEMSQNEFQGTVFTKDLDGNLHMYWLLSNQKVEKLS